MEMMGSRDEGRRGKGEGGGGQGREGGRQMERKSGGGGVEQRQEGEVRRGVGDWNLRI